MLIKNNYLSLNFRKTLVNRGTHQSQRLFQMDSVISLKVLLESSSKISKDYNNFNESIFKVLSDTIFKVLSDTNFKTRKNFYIKIFRYN